jgi:hypothetical protein
MEKEIPLSIQLLPFFLSVRRKERKILLSFDKVENKRKASKSFLLSLTFEDGCRWTI